VDDTLFYCFDSIDGERRLMTREAINSLRILADEIERSEDDFYNLTNKKATDSLNLSEET
jgi:L-alanine-DL-glutamate epimerase-like enolase superfamily enzyme